MRFGNLPDGDLVGRLPWHAAIEPERDIIWAVCQVTNMPIAAVTVIAGQR